MAHKPSYEDLEQQVKESDNKYQNLLNTSLVGIYQTSITGGILYVNEALATIFGFESPEEMLLESSIVRYKYAEDREFLIQTLMESDSLKDFEFEALTKSGEIKNIRLSALLEGDTISGMIMDITDGKKAEKALRESEERYRSLFKNNHSVMLLIDPESADIVDANPAAVSFYGWSLEALTGKKITDINTLSDKQVFQEMGKAKTEQRRIFYFKHCLANGEIHDVEVFSGPIKVCDRELLYSIIHDVSKRKRAEEAVRNSEENYRRLYKLMRLMADNIPDLIWAKDIDVSISASRYNDHDGQPAGKLFILRDISENKKLESQLNFIERMETIGTLAVGIAHDFNNLMMGMMGNTSLLLYEIDGLKYDTSWEHHFNRDYRHRIPGTFERPMSGG